MIAPREIVIDNDAPSGTEIGDTVLEWVMNGMPVIAVIVVAVVALTVARILGGAMVTIIDKGKVPLGILVCVAIAYGAIRLLG